MCDHIQKYAITFAELLVTTVGKLESLEEKVESLSEERSENRREIEELTKQNKELTRRLERVEREKEMGRDKVTKLEKELKEIKLETSLDSGIHFSRGELVERDCVTTKLPNPSSSSSLETSRLSPPHNSQTRKMWL